MTQRDLINAIATKAKLTKAAATTALNAFVDAVTSTIKKGDKVALAGFGTFKVRKTKARMGRNPQTGKSIKIPAKKKVVFRAATALKKKVM